ncbi:MAG TPA: acetyl-CoA C-acetyltransferase [Algoriphagus sp.]|jgi:acetyl-CoA C-acetyltransferase|uniref:acetyl-CoA C-acyltransferase n=1 Tax=unclassified Algoriphagus TaxID=2641541 RepID=UPI000C4387E0|nr:MULTISPECIES: acetyl-CoA C-acyltransferase [unclassified Algoriphagus]MAL11796.1 acetyl-CoA C-acyltransferase [Algoriphagus sp.]MAL14659.1 acetyl-CoA C-acyltransferase [Algoriphagus sp.]MAN86614.1 acetyl-CoA C-acyltransferase [Algoriphagus sp.]HAD52982.1 acetyl-CoA C-acetyltransferase [Algoriphagus sp.]HAH35440.1 acetyl-CoA C-acetyltransferase [Algoriphagus sp.]|tara:strand:- start:875 stop:2056 length:1182 start_codon:yes stop_codon:yes gene_type:complete
MSKEVYIVSAVRTPLGSFGGKLSGLTAIELGSTAIKGALEKSGVKADDVQEVFMGNVISANLGQAPARQAAIGAGIGYQVPCTTINKVCASGMKAVMFAAQSIMLGINDVVVAGGMESMSNVPFYVPKARFGYKYGNAEFVDGLVKDGLFEVYYKFPMGNCADNTAKEMKISREEQDAYAIQSYQRSADAWAKGYFKDEVIPVELKGRKGETILIDEDEEYKNVMFDKIPSLRPVFDKEGTVTAANASTMNDGASALVLVSKEKAEELGLKPLAKIRGFADAATDPLWFTTAPALAIPKAIKHAGLTADDVDFYEINEAFSAVALANQKQLNLNPDKLNVFGGAVSLGHPLGASGARIIATLNSVLHQKSGQIGVAGICNGGGGASALVLEKV